MSDQPSDDYVIPPKTLARIREAQARQKVRAVALTKWALVNADGHAVEERMGAEMPAEVTDGHHWEVSTPGRIEADATARAALLDERLAERNRIASLETAQDFNIFAMAERAEYVNEAYDLIMAKLGDRLPPAPAPKPAPTPLQEAGFFFIRPDPEPVLDLDPEPMLLPPNPEETLLSDYGVVGEPEALDLNEVPDVLKRFVEADETPAEFRIRLKALWQRFGIEDGKHFPGGGEPLSGDEKILMGDLMAVMNAHTFAWMRPSE